MIGILLKTHFLDAQVLATLAAIQQDLRLYPEAELVLGIDVSRGLPASVVETRGLFRRQLVHLFSETSHRRQGLSESPHRKPEQPFNWFHSDYSLLDFYACNPGRYEAIWQIEYDVSLRAGSWEFLARSWPYDLIAPGLKVRHAALQARIETDCIIMPDWYWWKSLLGLEATVGCFFPCIRVSAAALEALLRAYRSGISGYCEASLPSVLAADAGLRLASLSVLSPEQALIYHPHWHPKYKADRSRDFQLNAPLLSVD